MSDTFNEVKAIIKGLLGADEAKITPEARFREELEADSLDLVELIMAFEDKFGAEISDEVAQKIVTVGDAVTYIDSHKKAGYSADSEYSAGSEPSAGSGSSADFERPD